MPWFLNSYTGKLVHEDPPSPGYFTYEAALHTGTGWHELGVADSADAAQAEAWAQAHIKGGATPDPNASPSQYAANAIGQGTQKLATTGVGALLGDPSGLGRVVKIIVGAALLIIGLARMTGTTRLVAGAATRGVI